MSKAVMISIRPKWCNLIASGKKTIEIRKTKPNLETPFRCYIYCTNTKPFLVWGDVFRGNWETEFTEIRGYSRKAAEKIWDVFNGNVIGEFVCDAVIPMSIKYSDPNSKLALKEFPYTCLTDKQIIDYLGNGVGGYGWHISDLKIYDQPKELREFNFSRPPQSWCYVEELEDKP